MKPRARRIALLTVAVGSLVVARLAILQILLTPEINPTFRISPGFSIGVFRWHMKLSGHDFGRFRWLDGGDRTTGFGARLDFLVS